MLNYPFQKFMKDCREIMNFPFNTFAVKVCVKLSLTSVKDLLSIQLFPTQNTHFNNLHKGKYYLQCNWSISLFPFWKSNFLMNHIVCLSVFLSVCLSVCLSKKYCLNFLNFRILVKCHLLLLLL